MESTTATPPASSHPPCVEKEIRQWPSTRNAGIALAIIVLISGVFRFSGIAKNYPYMNYVDEGHIIRHAQNMYHEGSTDPRWYQYNAGMMNLTNLGVWLYVHLTGQAEGFRESVRVYPYIKHFAEAFPDSAESNYNIVEPPIFLLMGRIITAIMGTLSVLAFYFLACQAFPRILSLVATILFAFLPGIVDRSHVVNNDIPMMAMFTVMLGMLLAWRYHPAGWKIAIAGFCAGAAAAFKMSGVLYAGLPFLVILIHPVPPRTRIAHVLLLLLSSLVGVYALLPGLRGAEEHVLNAILFDANWYAARKGNYPSALNMLLSTSILGGSVLSLGALGLACGWLAKDLRRFAMACTLWLIPFLWVFLRHEYQPVRNLYPLAPMWIFFSAWAVWTVVQWIFRRHTQLAPMAAAILLAACSVMPAVHTVRGLKAWHAARNSRILTAEWLRANAQPGALVAFPHGLAFSPWTMRRLSEETGLRFDRVESLAPLEPFLSADYAILPAAMKGETKDLQPLLDDLVKKLKAQGKRVAYKSPGSGGVDLFWGVYQYRPIPLRVYAKPAAP